MNNRRQYLKVSEGLLCYGLCQVSRDLAGFQPVSPDARAAFTQVCDTAHTEHRSQGEGRPLVLKLGEHQANITIINSLACICTLLRCEQPKKTEDNCLVRGMYRPHCTSRTGRLLAQAWVVLRRVSSSVCVWMERGCKSLPSADGVSESGLQKSFGCPEIAAIVLTSGTETGRLFYLCLHEGRQSWRASCQSLQTVIWPRNSTLAEYSAASAIHAAFMCPSSIPGLQYSLVRDPSSNVMLYRQ